MAWRLVRSMPVRKGRSMPQDQRLDEVRANYESFRARLPELLESHAGKFAVIRHREIVDFFDTMADAAKFAAKMFPDHLYSVQEVTERQIELGFHSIALDNAAVCRRPYSRMRDCASVLTSAVRNDPVPDGGCSVPCGYGC